MAVEVTHRAKRHHRHGRIMIAGSLLLAIAFGSLLYKAPVTLAQAANAFITPTIHIYPAANGLAQIQIGTSPAKTSGLGPASEAGQSLQMQLLLQAK